jgi:predicted aminopeptidase
MLLSGCYYLQAAQGQLSLAAKRQPIPKVIQTPETPEKLRARLNYVLEVREFASAQLALPNNDSYRSYVDVGRPFVLWNVFATQEFSVEPKRWCFPIAGCVVYRGYFHESAAESYASRLRNKGYDAAIGGVPAYSTLGHFDDPVVSTMMPWGDAQLAATIFHELAHQVVYAKDDTAFNEAFASTVEEVGIQRWLAQAGRDGELAAWQTQERRAAQFHALLLATRERLQVLYATALPRDEMYYRKQQEFGRLKYEYTLLKHEWHGYRGYDHWFDRPLNNADLVPTATYETCVPGFKRLLDSVQGDLPQFYSSVKELAKKPRAERRKAVCEAAMRVEM